MKKYTIKTPFIFLCSLLIGLIACEKTEQPIPKHESGDVTTSKVSLGETYTEQIYFDLLNNSIVAQNKKLNFDLSFESHGSGNHILLNSSKAMGIIAYDNKPFEEIEYNDQTDWLYDVPSGNLDSTAIGDWNGKTYLVQAGYDNLGDVIGYYRLEINSRSTQAYELTYQLLPNGTVEHKTVTRNEEYNFVQFSFTNGQVQNEPKRDEFDLLFSQYTHVYPDGTPYTVTGVLSNNNVKSAKAIFENFGTVTIDTVDDLQFSEDKNVIGFEWKEFVFDSGAYIIFPEQVFIIKTADDRLYKLHFIDFYDEQGVKGTPTFEYQQL